MPFSTNVIRLLEEIEPSLRKVLIAILEEIERQREETVTRKDFQEFVRHTDENFQRVWKAIHELAEAQKRTEARVEELAEAQKRTEARVKELAEAQKRTEEEIRKLSGSLRRTREEVGGLSRSVAYALENEAFVKLPEFLKRGKGIKITEKMIRTEINEEEINIFAKGRRNGKEVVLIGESVLKLDDMSKLKTVEKKIKAVKGILKIEVIPLIVTHFAKKKILEAAEKKGIIVVQSFQW
jgi:chromosome segregation ATPase